MLTKEDCRQRAPLDGDVIYNTLTVLINNVARDDDGQLTYLLTYLLIDHARSGVVYNFGRFCSSVCMSVCQTITFEILDVQSSYLYIRCISRDYGSSSYMKVIGSRSRSQEQIYSKTIQDTGNGNLRVRTNRQQGFR